MTIVEQETSEMTFKSCLNTELSTPSYHRNNHIPLPANMYDEPFMSDNLSHCVKKTGSWSG